MNCPDPFGNEIVETINTIIAGYIKRLQQTKILSDFTVNKNYMNKLDIFKYKTVMENKPKQLILLRKDFKEKDELY